MAEPGSQSGFLKAVFGASKQKTEKEAKIDSKVEALLKAYKIQDESLMKKE